MNPKQFEFVSKVAFTKFCPCVISLHVSASVYTDIEGYVHTKPDANMKSGYWTQAANVSF